MQLRGKSVVLLVCAHTKILDMDMRANVNVARSLADDLAIAQDVFAFVDPAYRDLVAARDRRFRDDAPWAQLVTRSKFSQRDDDIVLFA